MRRHISTAMRPLLAFRDDSLEADFWAGMRGRLSAIDKFAVVLVFFNNGGAALHAFSLYSGSSVPLSLFMVILRGLLVCAAAQALGFRCAAVHPAWYWKRRDAFMAGFRLLRSAYFLLLSRHMATAAVDGAWGDVLLQRSSPLRAYSAIAKLLLTRGFIGYSFSVIAQYPARFALSLPLHATLLPVLLHGASCVAPMLAHPKLQPTVCALVAKLMYAHGADAITRGGTGSDGGCHPLAPQLLAYTAAVWGGLVLPLFLAYVVEAGAKARFVQRSVAAAAEAVVRSPLRDAFTYLLLLFNALLAGSVLTIAAVHLIVPRFE